MAFPMFRGNFSLLSPGTDARERYKGHDLLQDVWSNLVSEVPGTRLIVAGEGFGLVCLEAKRAGKPCIAAPGAPEEIVGHGVPGYILDPSEPHQIASLQEVSIPGLRLTRTNGRCCRSAISLLFLLSNISDDAYFQHSHVERSNYVRSSWRLIWAWLGSE